MKHGAAFLISCAAILILANSAASQERRVTPSELPPAVQKTAAEQSKGATVRGYSSELENGQREYEVEMTFNGHSRDVTIAANGKILEVEEQIAWHDLPAAVRDGLEHMAGSGRIMKVESLTKKGKLVAYEAQVHKPGKRWEIQVGPDGKKLSHPE